MVGILTWIKTSSRQVEEENLNNVDTDKRGGNNRCPSYCFLDNQFIHVSTHAIDAGHLTRVLFEILQLWESVLFIMADLRAGLE